jgi:hypothetical protein
LLLHAEPAAARHVCGLIQVSGIASAVLECSSWAAARALFGADKIDLILLQQRADGQGFAAPATSSSRMTSTPSASPARAVRVRPRAPEPAASPALHFTPRLKPAPASPRA